MIRPVFAAALLAGSLAAFVAPTATHAQTTTDALRPAWLTSAAWQPSLLASESSTPQIRPRDRQVPPWRRSPTDAQRRGMWLGAATGAVVGAWMGVSAIPEDCQPNPLCSPSAGIAIILATTGGALVGAGVGLIVGTIVDGRGEQRALVGMSFPSPFDP